MSSFSYLDNKRENCLSMFTEKKNSQNISTVTAWGEELLRGQLRATFPEDKLKHGLIWSQTMFLLSFKCSDMSVGLDNSVFPVQKCLV